MALDLGLLERARASSSKRSLRESRFFNWVPLRAFAAFCIRRRTSAGNAILPGAVVSCASSWGWGNCSAELLNDTSSTCSPSFSQGRCKWMPKGDMVRAPGVSRVSFGDSARAAEHGMVAAVDAGAEGLEGPEGRRGVVGQKPGTALSLGLVSTGLVTGSVNANGAKPRAQALPGRGDTALPTPLDAVLARGTRGDKPRVCTCATGAPTASITGGPVLRRTAPGATATAPAVGWRHTRPPGALRLRRMASP